MGQVQIDSSLQPGVLGQTNTDWALRLESGYFLTLKLETKACRLLSSSGELLLDFGTMTTEKFMELCQRNSSGKLNIQGEFFEQS